ARDVCSQDVVLGTIRRKQASCKRRDAEPCEEVGVFDRSKPEAHSVSVLRREARAQMTEGQRRIRSARRAEHALQPCGGFFESLLASGIDQIELLGRQVQALRERILSLPLNRERRHEQRDERSKLKYD